MYAAVFPLLTARALEEPFDYLVPDELAAVVRRGSVVAVRLGAQTVLGVVLGLSRDLCAHRAPPAGPVGDRPARRARGAARHGRARQRPLPHHSGAALALVLPPAGALNLRRLLEPTPAGLAALAAGQLGAEALERYVGGASADAAAPRLRRRGWLAASYRLHVAGARAAAAAAHGGRG